MRAKVIALALGVVVSGCPEAEEPVDGRVFITAIFEASVACFPSFLNEAEPIFLERQAQGQLDAAVRKFEADLANEDVEFSRAAYNLCLEKARANDCNAISDENGPCASVFRGLLNAGEECAENIECASGLTCFQELGECGTCTPLAVVGESCTETNCVRGARCDGAVCRAEPEPASFVEGQACAAQPGCGGLSTGLQCVGGTCQPITVVDEGEACEIGIGADRYCRNSSSTHICENNVCAARPGLGEPCSAVGACNALEAACVDGQCVDEGQVGDECVNGFGCQIESTCQQQTCVALDDNPLPPTCD